VRLRSILEMARDCIANHGLQLFERIRPRENKESHGTGFVAPLGDSRIEKVISA